MTEDLIVGADAGFIRLQVLWRRVCFSATFRARGTPKLARLVIAVSRSRAPKQSGEAGSFARGSCSKSTPLDNVLVLC